MKAVVRYAYGSVVWFWISTISGLRFDSEADVAEHVVARCASPTLASF